VAKRNSDGKNRNKYYRKIKNKNQVAFNKTRKCWLFQNSSGHIGQENTKSTNRQYILNQENDAIFKLLDSDKCHTNTFKNMKKILGI
jgi:hypothetical protein